VPLLPPLQDTFVEETVDAMALGCVTVAVADPVHPFASVIMQLYVPADKEPSVALLPATGDQLNE
jgi:hypothetical protein